MGSIGYNEFKKKGKETILKRYVDIIVLHIVFELYGKESKVNVY